MAGFYAPVGLVIWMIYLRVVGKVRPKKILLPSLAALLLSLMASGFIGYTLNKQAAIKMTQDLRKDIINIQESGLNEDGTPKPIDIEVAKTSNARGDMGKFEKVIREMMQTSLDIRNEYLASLNKLNWNSLLDPNRIANDEGLSQSKAMVADAKNFVQEYREKTIGLIDEMRAKIEATNFEFSTKDSILQGYDESAGASKEMLGKIMDYEYEIVLEFEKIINLLDKSADNWEIADGLIYFNDAKDLEYYNQRMEKITRLVERQAAAQEEYAQIGVQKLYDLEHELNLSGINEDVVQDTQVLANTMWINEEEGFGAIFPNTPTKTDAATSQAAGYAYQYIQNFDSGVALLAITISSVSSKIAKNKTKEFLEASHSIFIEMLGMKPSQNKVKWLTFGDGRNQLKYECDFIYDGVLFNGVGFWIMDGNRAIRVSVAYTTTLTSQQAREVISFLDSFTIFSN